MSMRNHPTARQVQIRHEVPQANQFDDSTSGDSRFAACAAYELNLCEAVVKLDQAEVDRHPGTSPLIASVHTIPARRTIRQVNEWSDLVSTICRGWATSTVALPDGRRQILSFLLPGDMFSVASLFESNPGHLIESITEVTYRSFKRSELSKIIFEHPDLHATFTKAWIEEKRQTEQLAVDLGRRMADERISRLILNLMERLAKRGMVKDQTFEFPLRHLHIADATGLTPVHVSRTLSEFRRSGLITISKRLLTVRDIAKLQRLTTLQ